MTMHAPVAAEAATGWGWRARCTCGWQGRRIHLSESAAQVTATAHAARRNLEHARKACGKVRFPTREDAAAALLKAKIQHSLRHNPNRREQRTYWCTHCRAWHLTSQPEPATAPPP
ncbi:MAG: hypothetical protein AB7O74_11680 [Candidatus Nanopelagicales bacterium]